MTDIQDMVLDGPHGIVPVRVYTPSSPRGGLVWAHGGAFAFGDLDLPESDWVARYLAGWGLAVVSVDYRLAPVPEAWAEFGAQPAAGHHFPVALEEIQFVYRWALGAEIASGPWYLGGASAGANLATGAILRLLRIGAPLPPAALLAYPSVHALHEPPDADLQRLLDAGPVPSFGPERIRWIYENYLGGPVERASIEAVPGLATVHELEGFPPTYLLLSEIDEFRTSGEAFAAALRAADVPVVDRIEVGARHGYLNEPGSEAAERSLAWLTATLELGLERRGESPLDSRKLHARNEVS